MSVLKSIFKHTPVYHQAYDTYLRVFKNDYWQQRIKGIRDFYRPLVKPGSLVFDIGANVGEYTRCFVDLGARVVAVEPQPNCVTEIKRVRPGNKVTILQCAIGATEGTATMHVSDTSILSTISDEWVEKAKKSERFSGVSWSKDIEVPVVTLDKLTRDYGPPDFIKIDVEGYESSVLDGLSRMPPLLSFEFNAELINNTILCLTKPVLADARFNYYVEDSGAWQLKEWVSASEMLEIASTSLAKTWNYGDIVARKTG